MIFLTPPPFEDSALLTEAVHLSLSEYRILKVLRLGPYPISPPKIGGDAAQTPNFPVINTRGYMRIYIVPLPPKKANLGKKITEGEHVPYTPGVLLLPLATPSDPPQNEPR